MQNQFIFVRCGDKGTAVEIGASSPPSLMFYYPGGEEMFRQGVRDAAGIEAAMNRALKQYSAKPVEFADYSEEAFEDAKSNNNLVVLVFADDKKNSQKVLNTLGDRAIARLHDKITFIKVDYTKRGRLETKWKVSGAPTVVVIDSRKELGPKTALKKIYGKKSWRSYLKYIQKGLRTLEK